MLVPTLLLVTLQILNCKALKGDPVWSAEQKHAINSVISVKNLPREYNEQSGSVQSLHGSDYSSPLIPVTVGNQTFRLLPDTGSSTTWIWSKRFRGVERSQHKLYQETGVQTQNQFSLNYGNPVRHSNVRGQVWHDTVVVAGVTATSLPVAVATSISGLMLGDRGDGILGLGLDTDSGCSPSPCSTFMRQVLSSLVQRLFTVKCALSAPFATYTFGALAKSQYEGSLAYVNVTRDSSWWATTLDGYSFEESRRRTSQFRVIVDTGTSFISLPAEVVDSYFSRVRGATIAKDNSTYDFPCWTQLPDLHLNFGAHKATLWAGQALASIVNHNSSSCHTELIISESLGEDYSVLGMPFFRSQFVAFDYKGPRLGFAQQERPYKQ